MSRNRITEFLENGDPPEPRAFARDRFKYNPYGATPTTANLLDEVGHLSDGWTCLFQGIEHDPTDPYYSSAWQALEERDSGIAKQQNVFSPFYVDDLIERDRDVDGSLDCAFDSDGKVTTSFGSGNDTAVATTIVRPGNFFRELTIIVDDEEPQSDKYSLGLLRRTTQSPGVMIKGAHRDDHDPSKFSAQFFILNIEATLIGQLTDNETILLSVRDPIQVARQMIQADINLGATDEMLELAYKARQSSDEIHE